MIGITPEEARAREICARLMPHTTSVHNVGMIAALLAEHDRRVSELLAANTAELERRRAAEAASEHFCRGFEAVEKECREVSRRARVAEALAERMWPIVEDVAGAADMVSRYGGLLPVTADNCRAAAALVREREGKEPK